MKKRIVSLLLSLLMLLLLLPGYTQTAAAEEPGKANQLIHIKNNHELREHLENTGTEHLILDKTVFTKGSTTNYGTSCVSYDVNGQKTIDLNGYDIRFDWQRDQNYYETRPDTDKGPALTIWPGASLTVYDTSKKQSGAIRSFANIYALNDTEFYNGFHSGEATYNCSILRDTVEIRSGGTLTLMSGSIIAGRSKQQWMTSGRDAFSMASGEAYKELKSHTGYGRQIICGTAVTVDAGGTFNCCGGCVEGRGFEDIGLVLEHGHNSGGVSFDKICDTWLEDACAAVHAKEGSTVRLYDGNFIGNTGAWPLHAEEGANVSVYSGYFKAEDQPYVILGHTQLPIVNALGYNRHIYVPVKANASGLTKEMFPYGDEGVLIYQGTEKKDKNRVVLDKENRGKGKESGDGSVSAGVTLVKGSSKVSVNKANYDLFDGKAASYTVCPQSAQTLTLADITNAVSLSQSRVEYAQNTSCILNMSAGGTYFPDDDSFFYDNHFTHDLHEIEWKIRMKKPSGVWSTTKWDTMKDVTENGGRSMDLHKALQGCKVGDVYQIEVRCTEEWVGKHSYTVQTVAVTPEITVVEEGKLCKHDYQLLLDTANCCADGVATYACTRCYQKIEKPSPQKSEHQLREERTVGGDTCWTVCLTCGQVFDEKAHDMAVTSTDVLGEHLLGVHLKCRYCGHETYETQEVACIHECSPNDLHWDENGHWSFCKKCAAKLYDTHHLLPERDEMRLCEGSVIGGAAVGCLYHVYMNGAPTYYHHEYVNGQYILIPTSFCTHVPLTIDYSHVNSSTMEKPKTVVWTIESYDDKGLSHRFDVGGAGDTLYPADYISRVDGRLTEITATVTFGSDVFSSFAVNALYAPMEAVEPTCGQSGRQAHWICANCGQTVTTGDNKTSKVFDPTIPATGAHVYDNDCDEECSVCGEVREAPHDWETGTDENGRTVVNYRQYDENYHAQYCRRCNKVHCIEGHQWVEEVIRSTCTEVGKTVFTCAVCGYSYEGSITVPAGHSYQIVESRSESCDEDGSVTYRCSVCGDEFTDTVPKLDHIALLIKKIPSTSTEHGMEEHYGCAMCDACFADEEGTEPVSPEELELPLDPENVVITEDAEYSYNETHHWCADDGGTVQGVGEHTYGEDGSCTECGYIPGKDLVLSEEEKKAGAVLRLLRTPEVGDTMPAVREYDRLPFRMLLNCYWWVALIILLAVAFAIVAAVLLVKLKRTGAAAAVPLQAEASVPAEKAAEAAPQPEAPAAPPEEP